MEDRKFRCSLLSTRDVKDISVLGLNENGYDNINNDDISLFALPSTGKITMNDVRTELKLNGRIGLGQTEVRNLAKIPSGRISLNDLKGKSAEPQPQDCDYYFENREDFDARRDAILAENNNDLSQKTFGFGDGVTSLNSAFYSTDITSAPKMIVARNVTDFTNCFEDCAYLTTIPQDLFDKCPNVTDFSSCFYYCSSLTIIPQGLFDNCINVTNFRGCFEDCSSLTTIPQSLFDKCTNATNFSYCFAGCSSLTTIPQGLFDNCINVTDFSDCFEYCSSLTTIPQGLFDNCPNVTIFSYCFAGCSSLTTIPQGLFDKCPNVTDFTNCFEDCSNITSSLPDVWNKDKFPKVTDGSGYAYGCTKAANYNEIPIEFGGIKDNSIIFKAKINKSSSLDYGYSFVFNEILVDKIGIGNAKLNFEQKEWNGQVFVEPNDYFDGSMTFFEFISEKTLTECNDDFCSNHSLQFMESEEIVYKEAENHFKIFGLVFNGVTVFDNELSKIKYVQIKKVN